MTTPLPGSEKRLAPLRSERGAALPGPTLVVYDPDAGWITDPVACENSYENERTAAATLVAGARPGELWIADRPFWTRTLLPSWEKAKACFIVREHHRSPKLEQEGVWEDAGACDTGLRQVQPIGLSANEPLQWQRIRRILSTPTESGETEIRLCTHLPGEVTAAQMADLYRRRGRIEGLFGRIESVLNREIRSLGHPRAALLGFAIALLAYTRHYCSSAASNGRIRRNRLNSKCPPTTWPSRSPAITQAG